MQIHSSTRSQPSLLGVSVSLYSVPRIETESNREPSRGRCSEPASMLWPITAATNHESPTIPAAAAPAWSPTLFRFLKFYFLSLRSSSSSCRANQIIPLPFSLSSFLLFIPLLSSLSFSPLSPLFFLVWIWPKMMPLRSSRGALRAFQYQRHIASGKRAFTSSCAAASNGPHRLSSQKRDQSTVTATAS